MQAFVTEPKLVTKNHKQWFEPGTLNNLSSHTDFYISKLFGPDADQLAEEVGIRAELKSKEGIWVVTSKTVHKILLKLGAVQVSDQQLEELNPVKVADSENSLNESE